MAHREARELLDHVLARDRGDGTRRRLPERVAREKAQEVGVLAPVVMLWRRASKVSQAQPNVSILMHVRFGEMSDGHRVRGAGFEPQRDTE